MSDDCPPDAEVVDELVQGLPGLPVEIDGVQVDEAGFYRQAMRRKPELNLPWADVASVRRCGLALHVERRGRPRAESVLVMAITDPKASQVAGAWREYVLREIGRDGALEGGIAMHPGSEPPRGKFIAGVFLSLVLLAVTAYALPSGPQPQHWTAWVKVFAWLAPPWAFVLLIFREAHRDLLNLQRWQKWSLTDQGVACGAHSRPRRLALGASDIITLTVARVARRRIPLAHLTGHPVVVQLLSGLAERAGAKVRPGISANAGCLLFMLATVTYFTAMLASAWAVLPGLVLLSAVWLVSYLRRRDLTALTSGRAMLERLGW